MLKLFSKNDMQPKLQNNKAGNMMTESENLMKIQLVFFILFYFFYNNCSNRAVQDEKKKLSGSCKLPS